MDAARTKPILFPEEWQRPKPLDLKTYSEFNSLARELPSTATVEFHDSTTSLLIRKLRTGIALTAEERTTVTVFGNSCRPYMDKFDRLTSGSSDFGPDSIKLITGGPFAPTLGSYYWLQTKNVKPLIAYSEALQGHWDMAFRPSVVFFRATRTTPLGMLRSYQDLNTKNSLQDICRDTARIAQMCPTADPIETVLNELNRLRNDLVVPDVPIEPWAIGSLYALQTAKRLGFDANMAPGKPGIYYLQESVRTSMELPKHILDRLPAGDPLRKELELTAAMWDSGQAGISTKHLIQFGTNLVPDLLTYVSIQVSRHSGMPDRNSFIAKYDLLRIALANRIHELRESKPAGSVSQLAEKYLGSEPLDPFTNKPFLYDETKSHFYSVGNNGSDDRNTTSPGSKTLSKKDDIYALPEITMPTETTGTRAYDDYDTNI